MNKDTLKNKKVIGVILAYKHAQFLEGLYEKLPLDILDEVIVTNDDSGDGIEQVAERLGLKCYSHPRMGYGGNMKFGMLKAIELGADYIVEIHGDGQFDTSFIAPAIKKMNEGYDLVLGSRFIEKGQALKDKMPFIKYVANISLTFIENIILGSNVGEFHTGARVYSKDAIEKVDLSHTSNGFIFGFEIIAQIIYNDFKIENVPVRCYYDKEHTSINLKHSTIYAFQTFGVLFYYILARLGFRTLLFHD